MRAGWAAKLVWRVRLVAERHPGVVTETELACLERDEDVGLTNLGLQLDEAKRLTAALQAEMGVVQIRVIPKTRNSFRVRALSISCGNRGRFPGEVIALRAVA